MSGDEEPRLDQVSSFIRVTSTGNSLILKITKEAEMLGVGRGDIVHITIRKATSTQSDDRPDDLPEKVLNLFESNPDRAMSLRHIVMRVYNTRGSTRRWEMVVSEIIYDLMDMGIVKMDGSQYRLKK